MSGVSPQSIPGARINSRKPVVACALRRIRPCLVVMILDDRHAVRAMALNPVVPPVRCDAQGFPLLREKPDSIVGTNPISMYYTQYSCRRFQFPP